MKAVLKGQQIPPLSQSRHGDMACETLYVQKHVLSARLAESEPAARGLEIHQILATYINHLVRTRRSTDLKVAQVVDTGKVASFTEDVNRHLAGFGFTCKFALEPFEIGVSSSKEDHFGFSLKRLSESEQFSIWSGISDCSGNCDGLAIRCN